MKQLHKKYQDVINLFAEPLKQFDPVSDEFLALYCLKQCYLVDVLLDDSGWSKDQQDLLRQHGWQLWNYFVKTLVSQIYGVKDALWSPFDQDDLMSIFTDMKHQLFLELISLAEDDINDARDIVLQQNQFYQMTHDLDHDHYYVPHNLEELEDLTKTWIYHTMLLEHFFTNTWWRASLDTFILDVITYGSFFLALDKTKVRILRITIESREDRLHLYLLIERYIIFSWKYDDIKDWDQWSSPTIGMCFDYSFKALKMEALNGDTKKHRTNAVCIILLWAIQLYECDMPDWREWLLELAVICLWWFECKDHTIKAHQVVESQITLWWDYRKLGLWLYHIMIHNRPMLQEEWFYGSYPERFTLQEYRYWNRMTQALDQSEFDEATMWYKKLCWRHAGFFRTMYHWYVIEFWKYYNNCLQAHEAGNRPRAIKCLIKSQKIIHDHRAFVVSSYPVDQITKNLENLDSIDYFILKAQHELNGTVFDVQSYIKSKDQQSQLRQTPKIGRNDPCPCNSSKKYKKCCGSIVL